MRVFFYIVNLKLFYKFDISIFIYLTINNQMAGNITLKELAAILNVSVSTISKALNDSHEISESTKKRIKELAKLHNYQPNRIALGLKSGKTNTIGVILPSIQNPFFARVLFGIEKVIAQSSYNIIICITNESLEKEVTNMNMLSNGVVDGFIVAVSEETQTKQELSHFNSVLLKNKPIVMFDRVMDSVNCNRVINNDYEAVYEATTKMLNAGRKHIALVTTIQNITVGEKRIKGYKDALNNRFGEDCKKHIITSESKAVRDDMVQFIKNNPKIDGIIALDQFSSYAALKATRYNNKSVPKDVAVIGYIAERIADNLNPELTTINQHGTKTGTTIANLIIKKLEAKPEERTQIEEVLISSTLTHRLTF